MGRLGMIAMLILMACSNTTEPSQSDVAGQYTLISHSGTPLPALLSSSSTVTAGSLVFEPVTGTAANDYADLSYTRTTTVVTSGVGSTTTKSGFAWLDGKGVSYSDVTVQRRVTGIVNGSTVTYGEYLYRRQ